MRFASLDVVTAAAVENISEVKIRIMFKYLHFLICFESSHKCGEENQSVAQDLWPSGVTFHIAAAHALLTVGAQIFCDMCCTI